MTAPWYSIGDLPAMAPGQRVRVTWMARQFVASKALKAGRLAWCLPIKRGVPPTWLPEHRNWGPEPDAWQPEDDRTWTWPAGVAPTPLRACATRMVSLTSRFMAVEDAEAAELAREMESDRETARVQREQRQAERKSSAPWRNIYEVTYSEPGSISRAEIEARLMRALSYDRLIPHDIKRQRTNAAVLADLKKWTEIIDADPTVDYRPPFAPVVEDFRDYLRVMAWLAEVYVDRPGGWALSEEETICAGRLLDPPRTWDDIGDDLGMTRQAVTKRYGRLLDKLLIVANIGTTHRLAAVVAAVQDRNKAHKRASRA